MIATCNNSNLGKCNLEDGELFTIAVGGKQIKPTRWNNEIIRTLCFSWATLLGIAVAVLDTSLEFIIPTAWQNLKCGGWMVAKELVVWWTRRGLFLAIHTNDDIPSWTTRPTVFWTRRVTSRIVLISSQEKLLLLLFGVAAFDRHPPLSSFGKYKRGKYYFSHL